MRTLLKTFLLGAICIALINAGLFFMLKGFDVSPMASFTTMLLVSLACLFALGYILHLTLERHRNESFRPDMGEVIMLQQSENLRVKPISAASQRRARGEEELQATEDDDDDDKNSEDFSALDQTGIFVADPEKSRLIPASEYEKEKAEEEVGQFSIPDLLQEIHSQGFAISELLKTYHPRIDALDARLSGELFAGGEEVTGTLIDARRILGALETRSKRLRNLITSHDARELAKAKEMLQQPLVIPRDAVHSLIANSDLPAIAPNKWDETLERLLLSAENEVGSLTAAQQIRENS